MLRDVEVVRGLVLEDGLGAVGYAAARLRNEITTTFGDS